MDIKQDSLVVEVFYLKKESLVSTSVQDNMVVKPPKNNSERSEQKTIQRMRLRDISQEDVRFVAATICGMTTWLTVATIVAHTYLETKII
jgi:hypothetical protein